ncbi:hypothetical protein PIB30_004099 [Stylosanthes scabra]|uniref:BURP domain-containing protein n=1 Tax=Stylosanthes scabra TaxID=79078 RepID=A0ABU6Z0E6_9FABA|nr:hypothetical protein [Stylosanthes scabra]
MFFRESMLKEGYIMSLPNIKDNISTIVFLPRSIVSKLPFSTSGLSGIFKATSNESIMGMMIKESVEECMRANSAGETKRCVGSMEDMIDFATSILGRDITVRSIENVNGSEKNVMIGKVKRINGIIYVSCHKTLIPYLLYYQGWQRGRSGRVFKYPYPNPNLRDGTGRDEADNGVGRPIPIPTLYPSNRTKHPPHSQRDRSGRGGTCEIAMPKSIQ